MNIQLDKQPVDDIFLVVREITNEGRIYHVKPGNRFGEKPVAGQDVSGYYFLSISISINQQIWQDLTFYYTIFKIY